MSGLDKGGGLGHTFKKTDKRTEGLYSGDFIDPLLKANGSYWKLDWLLDSASPDCLINNGS